VRAQFSWLFALGLLRLEMERALAGEGFDAAPSRRICGSSHDRLGSTSRLSKDFGSQQMRAAPSFTRECLPPKADETFERPPRHTGQCLKLADLCLMRTAQIVDPEPPFERAQSQRRVPEHNCRIRLETDSRAASRRQTAAQEHSQL
jgi:hypothetical protein